MLPWGTNEQPIDTGAQITANQTSSREPRPFGEIRAGFFMEQGDVQIAGLLGNKNDE